MGCSDHTNSYMLALSPLSYCLPVQVDGQHLSADQLELIICMCQEMSICRAPQSLWWSVHVWMKSCGRSDWRREQGFTAAKSHGTNHLGGRKSRPCCKGANPIGKKIIIDRNVFLVVILPTSWSWPPSLDLHSWISSISVSACVQWSFCCLCIHNCNVAKLQSLFETPFSQGHRARFYLMGHFSCEGVGVLCKVILIEGLYIKPTTA